MSGSERLVKSFAKYIATMRASAISFVFLSPSICATLTP
jgi:hypothetical protein